MKRKIISYSKINPILGSEYRMGWSPPKKITLVVSVFVELIGIIVGLAAQGMFAVSLPLLDPSIWSLIALFIVFLGWLLMVLGVIVRGL